MSGTEFAELAERRFHVAQPGEVVAQLRGDLGAQLLHPLLLLHAGQLPAQPGRGRLSVEPHGPL